MASLLTVRIDKGNSPNLGFRLQGGKDFGTPLVIQKVNGGSPAERAGLVAGDSVVKINNVDVYNLRHKDAQDVVVRAGPSFELTIQRGGSTWKPSVTPTGPVYSPGSNINNVNPVTRTSLAAKHTDNFGSVGTGHNLSAKPFAPQVNGAVNGGPKVVNKQYNSPLKLYSEESIAETLSAQTEVLSTGALGVNFKKNERNYDASNSEVLRALKEAENDPNYQDQEPESGVVTTPNSGIAGLRHVHAPETRPQPSTPQLPPGQNICADCERLIVGVFVRIKEKNLHVECFKCSTCGSSLKNVGYYNINNKLYCDIHAKSAALKNQPNSNLVPITVPPGGKAPAHAISSALSSHSYPTPSPLSPKINSAGTTYPAEETKENVDVVSSLPILAKSNVTESNTSNNNLYSTSAPLSFNNYINKASNFSGPKPFSHIGAPLSPQNTLPRTGPLSPVAPAQAPPFNHSYTPSAYSPSSGRFPTHKKPAGGLFKVQVAENIIWPPPQNDPEIPTACPLFYPPPSQIEQKIIEKRKLKEEQESEDTEYCLEVEEINNMAHLVPRVPAEYSSSRTSEEVKECLTEKLSTQILVENISQTRVTPMQLEERNYSKLHELRTKTADQVKHCPRSLPDDLCCNKKDNCEVKTYIDFTPKTSESSVHNRDLPVPLKWESPLTQAIRTTSPDKDTFACIPTKHSSSSLATALSVAPLEPFTPASTNVEPVPLPEETVPYFPPERPILPEKGSDAPAPPIRKKFGPADKLLEDLPKPEGKLRMLDALTTAPERSYSPFIEQLSTESDTKGVESKQKSNFDRPTRPDVLPASFGVHKKQPQPPGYYPPSLLYERTEEIKSEEIKSEEIKSEEKLEESSVTKETVQKQEESNIVQTTKVQKQTIENPGNQISTDENQNRMQTAPLFHGFSCSFQNKGDISQFSVDVRTSSPVLSPPPCTPKVSVTNQPTCVRTETVTESRSEKQQLTKKEEEKKTAHRREKVTLKPAVKQNEEVIPVKPQPQVALHKPTQLPQYQVELSAEAESELLLLEKKRQAELRIERQKQESSSRQEIKAPVIKIETEENPPATFRPVAEEYPPSQSFSPRPGSSTPSRIGNKPPAILPYYQVNLVPQYMKAARSNLFDPKSPAVSRSPSPNPVANRERSPSPLPESKSNIRPTSPAPGPPENPLKQPQSLPNPASIKVDRARESLKEYIPEYKSRRDYMEATQGENPQMYTSVVKSQNFPAYPTHDQSFNYQQAEFLEAAKFETNTQQQEDTVVSTSMQGQLRQAHLEQSKKSQSQSVEKSADGSTQIQRKRTVTEEFECTQKQMNVQIEKNVTSTKKYPFSDVNVPSIEASNARGRLTDPHRMSSSFLRSGCTKIEDCLKQQMQSQSTAQPPSGPAASASHQHGLSATAAKSVLPPKTPNVSSVSSPPDAGATSGRQTGGVRIAPRRGRGILNPAAIRGARIPLCGSCNMQVRGPFITALGKIWCPSHFICATQSCRRPLQDVGFVEEHGQLYCEYCFEQYLAPACSKCGGKIKGDCLKAIGKNFHPECFSCSYCGKLFGNSSFFLEDGSPYCEADWNELFTTKCFACAFPIEAGDRWVEALNNNYHSQCFNCTMCKKNLEGQSFFAKGGRPFCKNHAR